MSERLYEYFESTYYCSTEYAGGFRTADLSPYNVEIPVKVALATARPFEGLVLGLVSLSGS